MRWQGRRQSDNVEDRRSSRKPIAAGGGILGMIVVLAFMFLGNNARQLLQHFLPQVAGGAVGGAGPGGGPVGGIAGQGVAGDEAAPDPAEEELKRFVSVVLADTEDVWTELFLVEGRQYGKPTMVLFRQRVDSACGWQNAATGPFYCPLDSRVYIDLSFFDQMKRKLGAPGDFAQAYVIAHEVGHHVQNQLGISQRVREMQSRAGERESNELSVRLELQADFFAGVWAHHAERNWKILEPGDIEEALQAAAAIGDDWLQSNARGIVMPESFTHGTSAQRVRWFFRGLKTGDMQQGDTFSLPYDRL